MISDYEIQAICKYTFELTKDTLMGKLCACMTTDWESMTLWYSQTPSYTSIPPSILGSRPYATTSLSLSSYRGAQGSSNERWRYTVMPSLIGWAPTQIHPWGCCNIGYPSETHLKLKSCEIFFAHNICFIYPIILKFCTEHGSITAVLCAKFQNDRTTEK